MDILLPVMKYKEKGFCSDSPNGYLATIFSEYTGSEMPNLFSARIRKPYSLPVVSLVILKLVLVQDVDTVTQSPWLISHFSTI